MEDTTTRLQGHVQPASSSSCCGGCGCTGGAIRPRRTLVAEGTSCTTPQADAMSTCRYSRTQGGGRTWSRAAAWGVLLMTLLNTVTRTTQQSTTTTLAPVTVTAPPGCFQTFKANSTSDIFRGTCEEVTFPCTQLTKLQTINPTGDCSRYFQCAGRVIFDCPCGPGTKFNATVGSCVDAFYANCSCPDGRGPVKATPTPMPLARDNTALIAGVVVGVVVIIILIVVIVLLMKRRQAQQARPMTPTPGRQYSEKSMNYEDITDLKRGEDPNLYDNPPTFDHAIYDNHGLVDRDAIRPRVENATVKSTTSTVSTPPPLPAGHPSMKSVGNGIGDDEEPEYMETLE